MTKIKICGLRRIEDADICNKYLPDYVGFVFASFSKRCIDKNTALLIKQKISNKIKTVGVFYNHDIEFVADIANSNIIDLIQLHGQESKEYVIELKKLVKLPIIKSSDDDNCDYLILDNPNPGSGKTFDWSTINTSKPFFLAGGINCQNVKEALKLNPYCIDVSSGVETNGFKDEAKVKEIIRLVRNNE